MTDVYYDQMFTLHWAIQFSLFRLSEKQNPSDIIQHKLFFFVFPKQNLLSNWNGSAAGFNGHRTSTQQLVLAVKTSITTINVINYTGKMHQTCMSTQCTWWAGWYSGVHKARGRAGAGGRCGWHCAIDGGLQTQSSWAGHGHSGRNGGKARSRQGGWCLHFHLSHALSLLKQHDLTWNNLSQHQLFRL